MMMNVESNGNGIEKNSSEDNQNFLSYESVSISATYLLNNTSYKPKIGIICGSGLGTLADLLEDVDIFPYEDIPNFPVSTVHGHKSRLCIGKLEGVPVVLMQGRFHGYEGHSLDRCTMCVRVMKLMDVQTLIVTNAAGGLNPSYRVGDVMLLKDHLNLPGMAGKNPLRGPNDSRFGERFFALNNCYDKKLRKLAKDIAESMDISSMIHEGIYAMLWGPNYETAAEIRMLRNLGVDAVGMSTIPEVLVARHCDMKVFAFSLITNTCTDEDDSDKYPNHEEVLDAANKVKKTLRDFVKKMVLSMT